MPHGEHDLRVRKKTPDHGETQDVQRVLVDQALAGAQRDARLHACPVLLPNVFELRGTETGELMRILRSERNQILQRILDERLLVIERRVGCASSVSSSSVVPERG